MRVAASDYCNHMTAVPARPAFTLAYRSRGTRRTGRASDATDSEYPISDVEMR
jgi:hypothetical protein